MNLKEKIFGDNFNNQKDEQFPSRFRKQDYSSPKFVQQQKHKIGSQNLRFNQLMDASLYSYETPNHNTTTPQNNNQLPQISKSQSLNTLKNKQYIVFPKVQSSIREQQQLDRNNVFLQFVNSPHSNLMANKSISSETLKMIYSQPYIHYQNVKKIRKISPETNSNHVCKRSVIIPPSQGNYAMPGLPNSCNRSKKLNNLSFTKMQWNITNYNTNFALSKKELEIRDIMKIHDIKKLSIDTSNKEYYGDYMNNYNINHNYNNNNNNSNINNSINNNFNNNSNSNNNMFNNLSGQKTPFNNNHNHNSNQQLQQQQNNNEFNFLTTYSKSPKSDVNNTSSLKGSPVKQSRDTNHQQ